MFLEFRHLKLIVAVAEAGSVTRAGARLDLTQPALSHQLRFIEDRLGEKLFIRSRRGMTLTPSGERLYEAAGEVVAAFGRFESEARRLVDARHPFIRLAMEPDAWTQQALRLFQTQHPGIEVRLIDEARRRPFDALAAGRIDLAMITRAAPERDIRVVPLFRDEIVVIVRPDHALAGRAYCELHDLFGEPLLLHPGSAEERVLRSAALAGDAVPPSRVADVEVTESIPRLVSAGFGVSVMSRMAVRSAVASGEIVALPLTRQGSFRTWNAATLDTDAVPGSVRRFVDEMVAIAVHEGATPC
jgi:LysR family transcriptional regulator, regulator for metE and metH